MGGIIGFPEINADNQGFHAERPKERPAGARHTAGVPAAIRLCCSLFRRLIHLEVDWASRYDGGNSVLVDHLRNGIAQQYDILVERLDLPDRKSTRLNSSH